MRVEKWDLIDERGQFSDWKSGVELEEASNVADEKLLLNLVHEHFELLVVRLHEVLISDALEIRRHWREELGTRVVEHVCELVSISIKSY